MSRYPKFEGYHSKQTIIKLLDSDNEDEQVEIEKNRKHIKQGSRSGANEGNKNPKIKKKWKMLAWHYDKADEARPASALVESIHKSTTNLKNKQRFPNAKRFASNTLRQSQKMQTQHSFANMIQMNKLNTEQKDSGAGNQRQVTHEENQSGGDEQEVGEDVLSGQVSVFGQRNEKLCRTEAKPSNAAANDLINDEQSVNVPNDEDQERQPVLQSSSFTLPLTMTLNQSHGLSPLKQVQSRYELAAK